MEHIIQSLIDRIIRHKKYNHFDKVRKLQQRLDRLLAIKNKKK